MLHGYGHNYSVLGLILEVLVRVSAWSTGDMLIDQDTLCSGNLLSYSFIYLVLSVDKYVTSG